jgi:hypothetical protein
MDTEVLSRKCYCSHSKVFSLIFPTTLSKLIDFFPFPKKTREISPSRIILRRSGTKKQVRDLSPDLPRARVRDLSHVFFVSDLRRIIRQGEIFRFFFRKREEINRFGKCSNSLCRKLRHQRVSSVILPK